jgi:hypothetical protein
MRKNITGILLLMMIALTGSAQDLQLHYDFGRRIYSSEEETRMDVTLTLEQFKADKLGSWYYFIDMDIYGSGMKGAYAEISREFTFAHSSGKTSLDAHVEYDGGMTTFKSGGGTRFQNALLVGPALNGHNTDYSATWSVQVMYKQYFKSGASKAYSSCQLTGVWGLNFAKEKCTFSGYIDFWRGVQNNGHGKLIVMTEPQFWYNATKHFSVGTEIEVSNNFITPEVETNRTCYINPTLAVKYNF